MPATYIIACMMNKVTLGSPVSVLYGIGPEAERKLARLEIFTVYDLISYFPARYNDWSRIGEIASAREGEELSFLASVASSPVRKGRKRNAPVSFFMSDGGGRIELSFFNAPYVATKFSKGDKCFVHGVVTYFGGHLQMVNPYVENADAVDGNALVRPVYHLTAGITSNQLARWIRTALKLVGNMVPNVIPQETIRREGLMAAEEAYYAIHFPQSVAQAEDARRRLAYEELILLGIGMKKYMHGDSKDDVAPVVIPKRISSETDERWRIILSNLGFELTEDQKKALADIRNDLMNNKPMNRLVQGDVGSGKTAVAILAMAMTALMGKQAVLLAPTSVLAEQHYESATKLLKNSGLNVVLLIGSTGAALKREIKEKLRENEASVIIGTHALLSDDVKFADLALVIADEQHRFGVRQREKLLISRNEDEGDDGINSVHNLVMTATPIPRTLAMVIYGDMDTSVIRQKPAGRKEIKTHFLLSEHTDELEKLIKGTLRNGGQAYIVCPRIDDNDSDGELWVDDYYGDQYYDSEEHNEIELTSVSKMKQKADDWGITSEFGTGVLYGSMNEKTKQAAMDDFISGRTGLLISTTVIEVGVNNPNATLMIIMDADRFGLSTLHQLRGRIGRGDKQSHCILVSANKSSKALARMKLMCECSDGFELAGKDLEIRGPGDFFGTRQHGIPALRAANLFTDADIAGVACEDVNRLAESGSDEARRVSEAISILFRLRFGDHMGKL